MEIGLTDINVASIPLQNSGKTVDTGGSSGAGTQSSPDQGQTKAVDQTPDVVTLSTQATAVATSSNSNTSAADASNANSQASGNSKKAAGALNQPKNETHSNNSNTAYFAVDDKNNVVIRVVDSKGTVVKQIPPDEYLKMVKSMDQIQGHLFHTKA